MNLQQIIKFFLTNKMVLHIITFVAVLNIISYLILGKLTEVAYFIALSLLISYFSKNMIIVLGVPLILVNLYALNGEKYRKPIDTTPSEKEKKNLLPNQGLLITPLDDVLEEIPLSNAPVFEETFLNYEVIQEKNDKKKGISKEQNNNQSVIQMFDNNEPLEYTEQPNYQEFTEISDFTDNV